MSRGVVLGLVVVGVALAACTTDYQKNLEDPLFGLPNALANETQPGPPGSSAGGSAGATPACVTAGGTLATPLPTCTVTFKTDIMNAFKAANCQTAGSCHGGTTPANQPRIDPDDAAGSYASMVAFKLTTGKLYVNPCSLDETQSTIASNVDSTAAAADRGVLMPLGTQTGLPAADITKIKEWLKCGAPNN